MNNTKQISRFTLEAAMLSLVFLFTPIISYASCKNDSISVHCGKTPTSVFDEKGTLWIAFAQQGHVYVSHSDDLGKHYTTPIKVNPNPQKIYTNGENRPKIQIANHHVFVSWTEKTPGRFTGDIHFSRSINGGISFEPVKTINDDGLPIGHRFDAMTVTPSGTIYIAWLDKRDSHAAKQRNQEYAGISIYYAISTDQGKTFSNNIKIAEHTCECCRIAITSTGVDNATVMWRHIFTGGYRDHAIATLNQEKPTALHRATVDQWKTDACPHHGPSIDMTPHNSIHLAWFSNGDLHKGIYYGNYSTSLKSTNNIISIDHSPHASHSQVVEFHNIVWFVWKSFEKGQSVLKVRYSLDKGVHWSNADIIASTQANSDHPLLIHDHNNIYISWQTTNEGLRLIPLYVDSENTN
ncbi:MAG: exo-alpha-sialidase [Opitutaceae bacterium]|nr:exo-alpha-sialidase [Opitutaceae bacterium]